MTGAPGTLMVAAPRTTRGGDAVQQQGDAKIAVEIVQAVISGNEAREAREDAEEASYQDSIAAMLAGRANATTAEKRNRIILLVACGIVALFALKLILGR